MTLFENPFYILGAAMTDDRRCLRLRYDEKSLLSSTSCDDAFQTLVTPSRRLMAELCWFPGCEEAEIPPVLSNLQNAQNRRNAMPEDIIRLKSSAACIGELNQLLSLLPYMADSSIDSVLFEACRLFDLIDSDQLLETINASRRKAAMAAITSRADFEDALFNYQSEVCSSLVSRIRGTAPHEYDNIICRIASFGTSPIIDAVMRDYEYSVSDRLDRYENEVQKNLQELERFFNKDERPALIEKIQLTTAAWEAAIEPLRVYSETMGSDSAIRDYENRMVNDLLCHTYDTLAAQGPDTQEIRLPLGRIIMRITPEKEKYRNLRQILKAQITAMESAELCCQQAAMAEYQRLAEEAWQNEQKHNDEESRKRAKEAAVRDRERIAKSKETEDAEIASYKARYKKMNAEEEASAKEAEVAEQRAQERAAKKISLETEKRMLQTELSNLKGLFSRKRRKQIEDRISEINSELSTIQIR